MTSTEALEALELDGEITPETIKRQYRKLSLRHHPDRFRSPAEKKKAHGDFLRIKGAYDFLRNNPPRPTGGSRKAAGRAPAPKDDDLREWKRQFDKEQQAQEEKERAADRTLGRGEWRQPLRVHIFIAAVVLVGGALEPGRAWLYALIWAAILLLTGLLWLVG